MTDATAGVRLRSGSLNPCAEGTAAYDELVEAAVRRYGERAQGVGLALYGQLIFLRGLLAEHPTSPVLAARVAAVRDALTEFHRADAPLDSRIAARSVPGDPPLMEFDRQAFVQYRYAAVADRMLARTRPLSPAVAGGMEPGRAYLYVIDDEGRVLVWLRPFHLADLTFGRDRPRILGVPVAHPMMVPRALRARAAGELILVRAGRIAAVIANTKSGHFRPPPTCAAEVRRCFAGSLSLPECDVDVIAFG